MHFPFIPNRSALTVRRKDLFHASLIARSWLFVSAAVMLVATMGLARVTYVPFTFGFLALALYFLTMTVRGLRCGVLATDQELIIRNMWRTCKIQRQDVSGVLLEQSRSSYWVWGPDARVVQTLLERCFVERIDGTQFEVEAARNRISVGDTPGGTASKSRVIQAWLNELHGMAENDDRSEAVS